MKWYTGSIAEAVAEAQSKKSLFCVAIFGEDDASTALLNGLETPEIQGLIENEGVVAIRIGASSPEFTQFSAIYPNVVSPSIYCITLGGVAVQVITGSLDNTQLRNRFTVAFHLHHESLKATTSTTADASAPTPTPPAPEPQHVTAGSAYAQPSLEDRIERAKELAAAKQAQKAEAERIEAKRLEAERREAGKKVAELKRWQVEQEAKQAAEERKKDKQEEAALRQRLRQQIAQDRIDREARVQAEAQAAAASGPSFLSSPAATTAPPPVNYTGMARLQFRLPDGSSHMHAFDADTTLEAVRTYLVTNVNLPPNGFTISIAFPRRALTVADYSSTLRELELLPSAALLILLGAESSILPRGATGAGTMAMLYTVLQVLLGPFVFIWNWIRPTAPVSSEAEVAQGAAGTSAGQRKVIPPRRDMGADETERKRGDQGSSSQGQSFGRPDGNIHRFPTSRPDSDDEQGTYNGNSTQQM